ncbi:MAG: hypothetical protein MUP69_05040 [Candidatus Atribacteria bacterium]|nr:hypothetical protein [Candidatus Atribacteria bacterium]
MRSWYLPYIIGMVVVAVLVYIFAFIPAIEKSSVPYSGKEVFRTEAEYSQFKEAVGQKGVSIDEMIILSSSPPIVAEFKVNVAPDVAFPYGQLEYTQRTNVIVCSLYFVMLVGVCFIFLPVCLSWKL